MWKHHTVLCLAQVRHKVSADDTASLNESNPKVLPNVRVSCYYTFNMSVSRGEGYALGGLLE